MSAKKKVDDDDDWDTDPDFVNDVSEKDQRWGSKNTQPTTNVNMDSILEGVKKDAEKSLQQKSGFARGYGGDFGTEGKDQTTSAKSGNKVYERKDGHIVGDAPSKAANPHIVTDSLVKPSQG